MRILFLSSEIAAVHGTGGVGTYVATISVAMARAGHEVHVLSCREGADPSDELIDGVWVHSRPILHVKGLRHVWRGLHSRRRMMLLVTNYRAARKLGEFDIVETPEWQAEALLFVVARRAPVVVHLHTPHRLIREFEGGRRTVDDRLSDGMERWMTRHAASVTSPSHLVVDRLRSIGWLTDREVEIIRYPVDIERFQSVTSKTGLPSVLAVGRLERRKAPELLIEAAALLNARRVPVAVTFAGRSSGDRDGMPYVEWLCQHAERLGVAWHEPVEVPWSGIPALYQEATAVVICSRFESFSMAVVEAMAAGRPIVTTSTVGAGEVVVEPGQRLPADTAVALADALELFVRDSAVAAAVGEANRRDVAAACAPAEVARQRAELFSRLVAG